MTAAEIRARLRGMTTGETIRIDLPMVEPARELQRIRTECSTFGKEIGAWFAASIRVDHVRVTKKERA